MPSRSPFQQATLDAFGWSAAIGIDPESRQLLTSEVAERGDLVLNPRFE
jgi:hypothetical protein